MDNILTIILYIILIILIGICLKKIIKKNNKQKHIINIVLLCLIFGLIVFLYYDFKENKKLIRKYKINKLSSQKAGFVNFSKNHKDKIPKLLNECGLPINYKKTSHCFADITHQTCCMLGPEARKYADNSGNTIGKASVLAFKEKYGRKPKEKELTSWCTCFGSKVCSAYAKKFNDGTHIKFINNPNSKTNIRSKVHHDCEGYFRDKFNIRKHGTPGINNNFSKSKYHKGNICENIKHSILKNL